jgi:ubiquinone/menaquinone biosynthesis C-methylase UbiE
VRRGLERYAPKEGYDPGPIARSKGALLVVRKAGLFPGDWVIDVESGEGLLGVNVARAFTRAKVVATDADRDMILKARDNAVAEGCADRMRFVQALPDELPFKDECVWFTTTGLRLQSTEEPLDVIDEIHRVTGFSGKVYALQADLRKLKTKKPRGVAAWVFDDDALAAMREMGFKKVQMQQLAVLGDGARLMLVMAKRYDPAEDEADEEVDA